MSYRIDPAQSLESEIRRIGDEQLSRVIEDLGGEDGSGNGIHEARKRFKKLRGLYRIVRRAAPEFCHRENARMRDAARLLATLRDATAMIESVDDLRDHLSGAIEPETLHTLRTHLVERRDRIALQSQAEGPERIASAVAACRQARAELDGLSVEAKSAKASAAVVAKGWRVVCSRGKAALQACHEENTPEAFHELRKRAKYHGMHARLLQDIWPGQMRLRRRAAERLGDVLGREHDLTLLDGLIGSEPALAEGSDRDLIVRLVADRQAELRKVALEEAVLLFSDRPKHEGERIALLWKYVAR